MESDWSCMMATFDWMVKEVELPGKKKVQYSQLKLNGERETNVKR